MQEEDDASFIVIFFSFMPQNRFVLEGSLEIHNGGQNARFGSALAPVPDLNGDGFNDLVVGAPLEDDHKGAIYVFFSQQNRILRKYKQVFHASQRNNNLMCTWTKETDSSREQIAWKLKLQSTSGREEQVGGAIR